MIGLIFLAVFGSLFVGYSWLTYRGVHAVYRKTNSWLLAGIAALVFLLIPTGDTIFNRWHHQNVLCKRDDVGLKIFRKAQLSENYYDDHGKFKAPEKWGINGVVLDGRYQYQERSEYAGKFPFTGYEMRYSGVFDLQANRYLSYYADFWNQGSGWWLVPLNGIFKKFTYNGEPLYIGRGNRCLDLRDATNMAIAAEKSVFEKEDRK